MTDWSQPDANPLEDLHRWLTDVRKQEQPEEAVFTCGPKLAEMIAADDERGRQAREDLQRLAQMHGFKTFRVQVVTRP